MNERIQCLQQRIADCELRYQRKAGSVQLLAVSKGQSCAKIAAVYAAGLRCFGENYLQEALDKILLLPKDIEWHFIGPIQSNKTRKIAEQFAWVHSIDSLKIAQRLHEQRPLHLPPLNICLQVNISREPSKSGMAIAEAEQIAQACQSLTRLRLRGLMTIPKPTKDLHQQREPYQQLFALWETLRAQGFELDTLSMGMSDDFEAAIAEGSTLVRVGTAVFGARA